MARSETADERLASTLVWAQRLRASLRPLLEAHGDRVGFRPGAKGIAMVGLLAERPQRGRSRVNDLDALVRDFETAFGTFCRDIPPEKINEDDAVQSFLVRESQPHGGHLRPIEQASVESGDPVELIYVNDGIVLPIPTGKLASGILALRRDGGRSTPVLLQLSDNRQTRQVLYRVETYAALIDAHAARFAAIYGALLGEEIAFDGPTEKWVVWPSAVPGRDPQEGELSGRGIRVVAYKADGAGGYTLRVGGRVAPL